MRRIVLPMIAVGLLAVAGCARETETTPAAQNETVATTVSRRRPMARPAAATTADPTAAQPVVHVAAKPADTPVQIQSVKYKELGEAVKA